MRFYKTSEYAIRVLVFLGLHHGEVYSVKELNRTLRVPYKYLGRLMPRMAEAGFVETIRGRNGGYRMNQEQMETRLAGILDVVEGLENYERCLLGFDSCSTENPCPLHEHWGGIRDRIRDELFNLTIRQISQNKGLRL